MLFMSKLGTGGESLSGLIHLHLGRQRVAPVLLLHSGGLMSM